MCGTTHLDLYCSNTCMSFWVILSYCLSLSLSPYLTSGHPGLRILHRQLYVDLWHLVVINVVQNDLGLCWKWGQYCPTKILYLFSTSLWYLHYLQLNIPLPHLLSLLILSTGMYNDVSGIPGENLSAEIILDLMDCFNRFCEKYIQSIYVTKS